jgi:RND family efflux transporter MFP subunit
MPEENRDQSTSPVRTPERANRLWASIAGWLSRARWHAGGVCLLGLVSLFAWRATTSRANISSTTPAADCPRVAVAVVGREDLNQELACQAELRPYQEIDLHAKVAGYLQDIRVDIGDRVEAGQVIANIEVPELKDDLQRAAAAQKRDEQEVARAEAAYEDAHLSYTRLCAVNKSQPNLVALQDLDNARTREGGAGSALAAAKAQVEVSRADCNKLQTMLKYCQITAPFAGIISQRYADPGALIQAGTSSSTQTLPVVRLSQADRLRLEIPVSVTYVSQVKLGEPVEVRVESCGKTITGKLARSSGAVDPATRTMRVEVDVPNPELQLIPGMYASAVLRLAHREKALALPVEAVSRDGACTVLLVNQENRIEQRTIALGLETPTKVEVLAGLNEADRVVIGNRSLFRPGQQVQPHPIEPKLVASAISE